MPAHQPAEIRFWKYVDKSGDCWIWTGASTNNGWGGSYGVFNIGGTKQTGWKNMIAHRYSYLLHKGEFDQAKLVCHTCDNRLCVNPDHLFIGTPAENSADMVAKGRNRPGTARYNAKLTDETVLAIRNSSETQKVLSERYGISQGHVSVVRRALRWKHISPPLP